MRRIVPRPCTVPAVGCPHGDLLKTAGHDYIWHQEAIRHQDSASPSMPVSWPSSSKMLRTSQLVVVFPALPVTPTTASFLDGLRVSHGRISGVGTED